jgi:hypothetical protein
MKRILLCLALLLTAVPALQAVPARVNSNAASVASATSAAVTLSTTIGNSLVAISANNGSAQTPTSIATPCGTYILAGISNGSTSGMVAVYVLMGATATSCTTTTNYATATGINLIVKQYSGLTSQYALEVAVPATGPQNCCTALNITTQGASDLLIGIENFGSGSGTCTSFPSVAPFTDDGSGSICSSPASGISTGTFDAVEGPGTYSFNPNGDNTHGINTTYMLFAFRSVLPNPGRIQVEPLSATASLAYREPNIAGELLMALCENDRLSTGPTPAPTDSNLNHWKFVRSLDSDSTNTYDMWMAPGVVAGANTVTCPDTPAGIALIGLLGLNAVNPLGSSSGFFTQNPTSSFSTGPVQANSPSVILAVSAMMEPASATTLTDSSGFAPFLSTTGGGSVADSIQMSDRIVTSGSYSDTITASENEYFPQAFAVVLESAQVTVPALKAYGRGSAGIGPDGSLTAYVPGADVKIGDLIIVPIANNGGYSPGVQSDSQGNVYRLIKGGPGYTFGLFETIATANGALNATNTIANCIGVVDFGVPALPVLDQSNSAVNASATSLSTGSITTAQSNEFLVSMASNISDTYRLYYASDSAGWSTLPFACGGHYGATWLAWQPQVAQATYSNLFTVADAMPMAAAITSFKFGEGNLPVIRIIAQNRGFSLTQAGR